ncbi:MAG: hypothetical protein K2G53_08135, partial [Muribaculaceae bacterium]|nr:hypothetical protein [Muribaculaceae bacterium]
FIKHQKEMISEIVLSVLRDNSNRRIEAQQLTETAAKQESATKKKSGKTKKKENKQENNG